MSVTTGNQAVSQSGATDSQANKTSAYIWKNKKKVQILYILYSVQEKQKLYCSRCHGNNMEFS